MAPNLLTSSQCAAPRRGAGIIGEDRLVDAPVFASRDEILYAEHLRRGLRQRFPNALTSRALPWCVGAD